MTGVEAEASRLLARASAVRAEYGDAAVVIVDAEALEHLARSTVEHASLRALIAGLPDDDWQPFDWAVFSIAQEEARTEGNR